MSYADRIQGLPVDAAVKIPCRVATTGPITLSGVQTIDGVTLVEGDRVLVWQQADATANGIYAVNTYSWGRTKDFNGGRDVTQGTAIYVTSGATWGGIEFRLTTSDPIIGSSSLTFAASSPDASEVTQLAARLTRGYDTVAAMKAATDTEAGMVLRTHGRDALGDGGGAFYQVMTAAAYASVPDGYGDHYLQGGTALVAKLVIEGFVIDARAFGMTQSGFAAACAYAAIRAGTIPQNFTDQVYTLRAAGELTVTDQIAIRRADGGVIQGLKLEMQNLRITVASGGTLTATTAALLVRVRNAELHLPTVDAQFISSCIWVNTCVDGRIFPARAIRWAKNEEAFGYKFDGTMANTSIEGGTSVHMWSTDVGWEDDAQWLGRCWWFNAGDMVMKNLDGGYGGRVIYLGPDANKLFFYGGHFWNGRDTGPGVEHPVIIESFAGQGQVIHFIGTYLDNGYVNDHGGNCRFHSCDYAKINPSYSVMEGPDIRVYCTDYRDSGDPINFYAGFNRFVAVGFYSDPTDTYHWAGDYSTINETYADQQTFGFATMIARRMLRIFTAPGTAPYEHLHRAGGYFKQIFQVLADTISVTVDPVNGEWTTDAARVRVPGLLNVDAATELTIASGAITVTKSYHTVDTQSDAASDDLDTINGGGEGDHLYLRATSNDRTVVIKHGTGNIRCGSDVTLDHGSDVIHLLRGATFWNMVSFSSNGT